MGYRYECEEVSPDLFDKVAGIIGDAVLLGTLSDIPDATIYKCTIYDDDTDEELAVGYGYSESDARANAESNL